MSKPKKIAEPKPTRPAPKPIERAVFHDGRWHVWNIDGKFHVYDKRRVQDGRSIIGYDFQPLGAIGSGFVMPTEMPAEKYQDMMGAVEFMQQGIC